MKNVTSSKDDLQVPSNTNHGANEKFNQHIIHGNAIATNDIRKDTFDMNKAKEKSKDAMAALGAVGGLQSMLTAQMISIHELQQRTMSYANGVDHLELKKYYTNAAVKLSNCFVQQANVLAKLQGVGGKK